MGTEKRMVESENSRADWALGLVRKEAESPGACTPRHHQPRMLISKGGAYQWGPSLWDAESQVDQTMGPSVWWYRKQSPLREEGWPGLAGK